MPYDFAAFLSHREVGQPPGTISGFIPANSPPLWARRSRLFPPRSGLERSDFVHSPL